MGEARVDALRRVLEAAAPLLGGDDPIVQVVGARVSAIVIDTLLELDPDFDNPWDHLLPTVTAEPAA